MARIRTVKPELFRHEELFEAELECGLPLRLSFIGLLTCCDREGRFVWRPRQLKLDVMPYDETDFSRVLDALFTRGFLVKYEVEGKIYGCIPSFKDHQQINNKEQESKIPPQSEAHSYSSTLESSPHSDSSALGSNTPNEIDASSTREPRDSHAIATRQPRVSHATATPLGKPSGEGKGREGKGKGKGRELEGKTRAKRATQAPNEFSITDEMNSWLIENKITIDPVLETEKFLDYHRSKGTTFKDWISAWRNWMRNSMKFSNGSNGYAQRTSGDSGAEFQKALESTDWIEGYGKSPFSTEAGAYEGGCRSGESVDSGDYPDIPQVAGALPEQIGCRRDENGLDQDTQGAGCEYA